MLCISSTAAITKHEGLAVAAQGLKQGKTCSVYGAGEFFGATQFESGAGGEMMACVWGGGGLQAVLQLPQLPFWHFPAFFHNLTYR